jgi:hypothetical protein
MMLKGSVHQEDITMFKVWEANSGASKYACQQLTGFQGETDESTDTPL